MEHYEEKRVFPAQLENLHPMMAFIAESSRKKGFDDKTVEKILLAAEEALVNVISYAYPDSPGDIEIICSVKDDDMIFVFKDNGVPFNPLEDVEEVDVTAPLEERSIGGLGVFMIKQVMDDVSYQRENDMNILSMTKR